MKDKYITTNVDKYQLGYIKAVNEIIELIENWDVEPCCHGIKKHQLLNKLKEKKNEL